MVEILKQPQYEPVPVARQVMIIFAGTNGFVDDLAVEDVKRFEDEFLAFMDTRHPEIGEQIGSSGALSDDLAEALRAAIKEFRSTFMPSGERGPLKEAEATPLSQEEQEALKRFRRPTAEEIREKAGPAGQAEGTAGVPF